MTRIELLASTLRGLHKWSPLLLLLLLLLLMLLEY